MKVVYLVNNFSVLLSEGYFNPIMHEGFDQRGGGHCGPSHYKIHSGMETISLVIFCRLGGEGGREKM